MASPDDDEDNADESEGQRDGRSLYVGYKFRPNKAEQASGPFKQSWDLRGRR